MEAGRKQKCGFCPRTHPPRSIRSLTPSASRRVGLIEIRGRRSNACDSDSRQGLRNARHCVSNAEPPEIAHWHLLY